MILYSAVEPPIPTQMSASIDDGDVTRRTHLVKDRLRQKVPADDADERGFGTSSASICVIRGQLLFLGSAVSRGAPGPGAPPTGGGSGPDPPLLGGRSASARHRFPARSPRIARASSRTRSGAGSGEGTWSSERPRMDCTSACRFSKWRGTARVRASVESLATLAL